MRMTTKEKMRVQIGNQPETITVRLTGDLRLFGRSSNRQKLLNTFRRGIASSPAEIVLNLEQLAHVDAHGIATVAQMLDECSQQGIQVKGLLPRGVVGLAFRLVRVFDRCSPSSNAIAEPEPRVPDIEFAGAGVSADSAHLPQRFSLN